MHAYPCKTSHHPGAVAGATSGDRAREREREGESEENVKEKEIESARVRVRGRDESHLINLIYLAHLIGSNFGHAAQGSPGISCPL